MKFKVGDKVKVVVKGDAFVDPMWIKSMDYTIGLIGVVVEKRLIFNNKVAYRVEIIYNDDCVSDLWYYNECSLELVSEESSVISDNQKDTNPKDAIGGKKLPMNLVPSSLMIYAATSFAEGASKYGNYNWRVAGVRASIYKAALERHLAKWWNGETFDKKTNVHHLASVIACAGIILDAELVGKLEDDRAPYADIDGLIGTLEKTIEHLYELNKDKNPKHYKLGDK